MSSISIRIDKGTLVSGLVDEAQDPLAWYVLAHGAGAGMHHPFMAAVARRLSAEGISVLRYQFPYMEAGSRRPDPPAVAQQAVRAAVGAAFALAGASPIFAGGKSFGGRMTSQAQAAEPLAGVRGLVFLGYPLHPTGKPSTARAEHLDRIGIPMLFIQGARDALADPALLADVTARLPTATLAVIPNADHSFHAPAKSGRRPEGAQEQALGIAAEWIRGLAAI